jgi:hypothetical protein
MLCYEGIEAVYRQLFPAYQDPIYFQLGICGANARGKPDRPNEAAGDVPFGHHLTFANCTDGGANEGGCFSDAMRTSFGYARQPLTFAAALEADGGGAIAAEATFPDQHAWTPQAAADYDFPWTVNDVEQPPPEWSPRAPWEPVVGYPWQRPRKRCNWDFGGDPVQYLYSYMYQWDPTGAHDWLCDFRKMGGFPITLAFLADASREKLIAATTFRAAVLLRPGATIHLPYRARFCGLVTRDFALRFAKYAFQQAGDRYTAIYCRPLLATAPAFTRRTTYAALAPYFHTHFAAVAIAAWDYVPYAVGPPEVLPRVESADAPTWANTSGGALGPFGGVAVYGTVGSSEELMWITPINPAVSVPDGDSLRVADKVRFRLDSV